MSVTPLLIPITLRFTQLAARGKSLISIQPVSFPQKTCHTAASYRFSSDKNQNYFDVVDASFGTAV